MMKKVKSSIFGILVSMVMMANTAYAMPNMSWNQLPQKNVQSVLLMNGQSSATDTTDNIARGQIFSTGIIEITNQQDGTLHISVDTYAHVVVDKIYQTVFLEVWNEDEETWDRVNYWDFERTREEESDLSAYHVGFTVTGCKVNRYYRAQAIHMVQLGDDIEAKSTKTNGVLLTDHAV